MSAPLTPIGQIAPDVRAQFDSFLADNPDQVTLNPSDKNTVAQPTEPPPPAAATPPEEAPPAAQAVEEELPPAAVEEEPEPVLAEGEEAEAEPGETELPPLETLSELAELFEGDEVDEGSLLELTVTGRGEGQTITLGEALQHYREGPTEDEHFHARMVEARGELQQEHDLKLEELSQMTQGLIAAVGVEFEGVNWDTLKGENPEEYIRLMDRRNLLNDRINNSIGHMRQEMTKREQSADAKDETYIAQQIRTLHQMHPTWRDGEIGSAAMQDIEDYVQRAGFSQEMRKNLKDARQITTVWEAAQWRKLQASKPDVQRRLRGVPRTLRATARAAAPAPREAQQKQHAARVRAHSENGTVETAAALFMDRGL